jgi:hypothetical protein
MPKATSDPPVGVIVDCEAQAASDARAMLATQIAAATSDGDVAKVQTLADQLGELLQTQGDLVTAPIERIVELTADDLAALATAQEEGLAHAKVVKAGQLQAALTATGGWVMEAFENGGQLTTEQKKYRDGLRSLFAAVDAATDAAGLDAIEIPEPPTT